MQPNSPAVDERHLRAAKMSVNTTPAPRNKMRTALLLRLHLSVAFGVVGSSGASAAESPNNLSLARAFPTEKLGSIVLPRGQWHPFPTLKGRERWQELPKPVTSRLMALVLHARSPSLKDTWTLRLKEN